MTGIRREVFADAFNVGVDDGLSASSALEKLQIRDVREIAGFYGWNRIFNEVLVTIQ